MSHSSSSSVGRGQKGSHFRGEREPAQWLPNRVRIRARCERDGSWRERYRSASERNEGHADEQSSPRDRVVIGCLLLPVRRTGQCERADGRGSTHDLGVEPHPITLGTRNSRTCRDVCAGDQSRMTTQNGARPPTLGEPAPRASEVVAVGNASYCVARGQPILHRLFSAAMEAHTTTDHTACFHPVKELVERFFIGSHSPRSCRRGLAPWHRESGPQLSRH